MTRARWYVVKTKARQEWVARDNLMRQGYGVWLPQLPCERHRRGKWQPAVEPLFPGYLFVELEPGVHNFSPIRSTRGVAGLVSFAHEPRAMPPGSVEALRQFHSGRQTGEPAAPFRTGQKIRLVNGPFAGWEGVYASRACHERVLIMLQVLGKPRQLAFARDSVVPV